MFLPLAVLATAFTLGFTWVAQVRRYTVLAVPFLDVSEALSACPVAGGPTIAEAVSTVMTVLAQNAVAVHMDPCPSGRVRKAREGTCCPPASDDPAPVARTGNVRVVSPACFPA
ncbi:hypothetical protein GCM10018952_57770 [Streptosporangium vulgare]